MLFWPRAGPGLASPPAREAWIEMPPRKHPTGRALVASREGGVD